MSCSGAMYGTVPTMVLTAVSSGAPRSLATPKSTTLTLPSEHKTMFSSLRSRWMTSRALATDSADDVHGLFEAELVIALEARAHVLAVEVLEHDVGRAVVAGVVVVDLDD